MNNKGIIPAIFLIIAVCAAVGGPVVIAGTSAYNNCPAPGPGQAACELYVSQHFPGIQEGSAQYNNYVAACIAGNWPGL